MKARNRFWYVLTAALWPVFWGSFSAATSASPIEADEGRPHVSWEDAGRIVGRIGFVYGRVVNVGHSERVHFLNFESARPSRFTVIVPADALPRFSSSLEELYLEKPIRVRGIVDTYQGQPQIRVLNPSQIEIMDKLPQVAPPPAATAAKTGSDEFTIATYNVLNLFDDADDPYSGDETTPAKSRAELERLAKSIRAVDADVLALQEVENRGYLERFVETFLSDLGYENVVLYEGNDPRGIDVGIVSRLPVGPVRSYRHTTFEGPRGVPTKFERDLLVAEINPPKGEPFEFWVVHLKSNYEGRAYAEPIRILEATAVRRIMDRRLEENPRLQAVLCGDFNDLWESQTLKTLVGSAPTELRAFVDEIPEQQRVTYNQEPYRTMIDFLLCTPTMAERYVKGSYKVHSGSVDTTGSDHNPVSAHFRLGASGKTTSK